MPDRCATCHGLGKVNNVYHGGDLQPGGIGPCPKCHGSGRSATMPITPEERDEIMRLAWHWKQCIVGSKGSVEANDALSAYLDSLTEQERDETDKRVEAAARFTRGIDELADGADHVGYGIHQVDADGEIVHGNRIVVYGDEGLRDRILAALAAALISRLAGLEKQP